jgi:hypothetical protein
MSGGQGICWLSHPPPHVLQFCSLAMTTANTTVEATATTVEAIATAMKAAAMECVTAFTVEVGPPMEAGLSVPVSVVITAPAVAAAIAIHKPTIE